jgi:hypothetical protein
LQKLRNRVKKQHLILKRLRQKMMMDEGEELNKMLAKIDENQTEIQETSKEIRLLRRLQIHQGNRLVDLEDPETFPAKIKHLIEERKFQTDKNKDLMVKLEQERAHMDRQQQTLD